jgi:hypothetical protein
MPLNYKPTSYITVKCKFRPRTGQEIPEGEQEYSSTLSLSWTLEGMSCQRHAQVTLPPGKRPGDNRTGGRVDHRAGLDRCRIFHPTGIRSSDRPARSEWLYRLGYCGPQLHYNKATKLGTNTWALSNYSQIISTVLITQILHTSYKQRDTWVPSFFSKYTNK